MAREFCVPKRQVTARVILPGQPPARFGLFLGEGTGTHAGPERPSDILNGSRGFLPAIDVHGTVILLNSEAVMVVSVAAGNEFEAGAPRAEDLVPDRTTKARVEVTLQDGTFLRGTFSYLMPEAQSRLQDFLNTGERFVALREDGVAHLINKGFIARVHPI
jgi:hypothetical protein